MMLDDINIQTRPNCAREHEKHANITSIGIYLNSVCILFSLLCVPSFFWVAGEAFHLHSTHSLWKDKSLCYLNQEWKKL